MGASNLFDHEALLAQVRRQRRHAWDLELDIAWAQGIDTSRPFLPLDIDSIAFPGASAEQRLALSQFMGLVINSTIAEMESVINRMRDAGWAKLLRSYPVNPEMWELGELFFQEEVKHAHAFYRYNQMFCKETGIDIEDMDRLLPKAFGSLFLRAIIANSKAGGHAFWWVVAIVEEVSILLYKQLREHRAELDPLFHEVHLRHMEEESRHHNYAFLILDLVQNREQGLKQLWHKKTDFLIAQSFSSTWVLTELSKIFVTKELAGKHPFFGVLASCLPLIQKLGWRELISRLFTSAPYISLVLNARYHPLTTSAQGRHGVLRIPMPTPEPSATVSTPRRSRREHNVA